MRPKIANRDAWIRLMSQTPSPVGFWYRESPRPMVNSDSSGGQVTPDEPFPSLPGMMTTTVLVGDGPGAWK